jgi:phytoene dehydrogenase-like protein
MDWWPRAAPTQARVCLRVLVLELRAAFAGQGVIGSFIGPETPGSVYVMWHHMFGEVNGEQGMWGYVRGGMGRISLAMAASAEAHGTVIRTNSRVAKVLISNGKAEGVRLESGEEFRAKAVLSNAEPKRTFLHDVIRLLRLSNQANRRGRDAHLAPHLLGE